MGARSSSPQLRPVRTISSSREAVSAHVAGEIELAPVCVPEGALEDAAALAEAVFAAAPVIYFTPDGEGRLALG